MKTDTHVRLKTLRYIAEADQYPILYHSQSKRFENLAYLSGAVLFLAFLKFPVIRIQPGFRRVGASAALALPFYLYMSDLA